MPSSRTEDERIVPSSDVESRWVRRYLWPAAFVATIALSYCSDTRAAGLVVGAHLHTLHFSNESERPESLRNRDSTPGLYVRSGDYRLLGGQPTAGLYRNSLGRTTVYGGLTWESSNKRWAASLALASGYRIKRVDIDCPAAHRHKAPTPLCWYEHGRTNAHLLPIGGVSLAIPEALPYLRVTPRVIWLGKGLHLSIEKEF